MAYAAGDYIYGSGHGDSFDSAFAEAQTEIAQQISVRVEAVSQMKTLDIEAEGKAYYSQSIEKSIRLTVDQLITGIEVLSRTEKDGVVEVKAGLDKDKYLSSLKGELDRMTGSAQLLIDTARAMAQTGKPLLAVKNYLDAQTLLPDLISRKTIHDHFASRQYPISADLSIAVLEFGMRAVIGNLIFRVHSGNTQAAPVGSDLPEPIVFAALYKTPEGSEVPMAAFPVKISYADDSLIEKGLTDADGLYRVWAKALNTDSTLKVQIKPDITMLPAYLNRLANQSVAAAFYKIEASQAVEIRVKVIDESGQRVENVERMVAKALGGNGFVISEKSDLELHCLLTREGVDMVEGLDEPKYVATVLLDMQLRRGSDPLGLGSFSAKGSGLSIKNEDDAYRDAISKISINGRKLSAQVLERLQGK